MGPTFQHPLALGADLVGLLGHQVPVRLQRHAGRRGARPGPGADGPAAGHARHPGQHPAARRVLDARRPAAHRGAAHEPAEQERAAHRRGAGRPPQAPSGSIYPSLFTDPEQVRIRDAQCGYPGGIFSSELDGGKRAAFEFLRRLRIAKNAVSLGGVETLACHPATTTHSEMSRGGAGAATAWATTWCASRWASRTGATCSPSSRPPSTEREGGRARPGQPATARASSTMERGDDPSALLLTMTSPSFPARTARAHQLGDRGAALRVGRGQPVEGGVEVAGLLVAAAVAEHPAHHERGLGLHRRGGGLDLERAAWTGAR